MSAASAPGTSESPHVRLTLAHNAMIVFTQSGAKPVLTRRRHLMRHVTLRPVEALLHVTT
jgi:hypothetical protein